MAAVVPRDEVEDEAEVTSLEGDSVDDPSEGNAVVGLSEGESVVTSSGVSVIAP